MVDGQSDWEPSEAAAQSDAMHAVFNDALGIAGSVGSSDREGGKMRIVALTCMHVHAVGSAHLHQPLKQVILDPSPLLQVRLMNATGLHQVPVCSRSRLLFCFHVLCTAYSVMYVRCWAVSIHIAV